MSHRRRLLAPTQWSSAQLDEDRRHATETFRRERLEEPLEEYLERFDEFQGVVEDVLERTVDLAYLQDEAPRILSDPAQLIAFRYLAGPPISEDDLKTLVDTTTLSRRYLGEHPELVSALVSVIRDTLDRRRFPWVSERREPTEAERNAAILASAALIAAQRVATGRRNESKAVQEQRVREALTEHGFMEVTIPEGRIHTLSEAPEPGHFCRSVNFGPRNADLVVGLWDRRHMPIECKVSNSSVNSFKRLNNDAAVKAEVWREDFGRASVVPAAVLSGVYKLDNLEDAQLRGLTLYWAHRLSDLTEWIEETRSVT